MRPILAAVATLFWWRCRSDAPPLPAEHGVPYGPHISQRLDIYHPATLKAGRPSGVAILIHGGGWEYGTRSEMAQFVPFFAARSYVTVSLDYRLAAEARAPAAVEDVRLAFDWIQARATGWGADVSRLLVVGFSAGAHLAVLAAIAPPQTSGGRRCHPQAIVSFWGVMDVLDLLQRQRTFAAHWIGDGPGALDLARRMSPLSYDALDAPPLCAVHSSRDDVVPFAHSVRIVEMWHAAKRPAKLIQLSHRGHGAPNRQYSSIFREVFGALEEMGVGL